MSACRGEGGCESCVETLQMCVRLQEVMKPRLRSGHGIHCSTERSVGFHIS